MFLSLTLTPVLNVKLSGNTQHGWFYNVTEPFFRGLDRAYGSTLRSFMRYRWASLAILVGCFGMIWYFNGTLKSELAPLEDRSIIRSNVTAPEGTDYDQMESIIYELSKTVMDSVPEREWDETENKARALLTAIGRVRAAAAQTANAAPGPG